MIPRLFNKCPKCGNRSSARIRKEWYMRFIPLNKRYECQNCRYEYLVNFWVIILLMPIIITIKFITWVLWDLSGLRFLWEKIRPPIDSARQRRPASTFSIWATGIFVVYVILFNFASQRYENRITILENSVNSTSNISEIQNLTCPNKPNIYEPMSIFRTFFEPANQEYKEMIDRLRNTIPRYKDLIDSVYLKRVDLRNPNPQ